jgi:peptide/nickel transport system substrate-binding protein
MKMTKKSRMVGALAVALAGATALSACGSSSNHGGGSHETTLQGMSGAGMYGTLPAAASTQHSGMLKVGLLGGSPPTYIMPIIPGASGSIYDSYDFSYQSYRPLYWLVNGTSPVETPSMSLADDPVWSNGDKTVTITLKNYKWSDGQPVTSQDVAFSIDEIKAAIKESPANWYAYSQGLGIPDEVASVTTPDAKTAVINLTKAVNPTWFFEDELGSLVLMPSHAWDIDATGGSPITDWATNPADAKKIYDYLNAQSKSLGTYATNPLWQVVDGPYKLSAFNSTTGDYTETPNAAYSGPHAKTISPFETITYTTDAAEYTALKAGAIDMGWVPTSDVPEAKSVSSDYTLWGFPGFGWQGVIFNFKDTTGDFNNIIGQLYIRQALAHLVDQQGYVDAYLHGAGTSGYGIVSQYPSTPFAPADAESNPYPYSPSTAASLLKSHGWSVVPDGTDTCTSPGTGPTNCGAGIPAGTKLAWNLDYASEVTIGQEYTTNLASVARSVGIEITLKADSFNDIVGNDNDVASPADASKWAMSDFGGFTDSTYPTTEGLLNYGGGENMGGYDSAALNQLVNDSITSPDPVAVKNELAYVTQQEPFLFQPNPDWDGNDAGIMAISKQISGPPSDFADYSQYQLTPEFWYFK